MVNYLLIAVLTIQLIGSLVLLYPVFFKKRYSIEDHLKAGLKLFTLGLCASVVVIGIGIVDYYLNVKP